jgi:hypothetical protein
MSLPDLNDPREVAACTPSPVRPEWANPAMELPFVCAAEQILAAMQEFVEFLGAVNLLQRSRNAQRLESILAPATFSAMVSDFLVGSIPRYCPTLVKNCHHNGHPDLVPPGRYPGDAILRGSEGIEVKSSRYRSGWQGHNKENCWLLVFMYEGSRPSDHARGRAPTPFQFVMAAGAPVVSDDWSEQKRGEGSRRTPTAGVIKTGSEKVKANWIYKRPDEATSL